MQSTAVQVAHPLDREIRLILRVAMVIFVYTIGIGILNGLDLVEFSRTQLLSHLHGGTLGWMTLAILSFALWLFGGSLPSDSTSRGPVRGLAVLACVAIAGYVLAFATTTGGLRPLAGVATLAALIGFAAWSFARARHVTLTVPHLLALLGLTSSVLGGMFGVINGLAIAFSWTWVPESFFEAHPGTMEIGFVMPVAMGVAEWGLRRHQAPEPATRAGKVQVGLMFLGFAWVLGMILAGPAELIGLGMLFAIVAIVIFFVRLWGEVVSTSLTARSPARHALAGGVLLGITILYIFTIITMAQGDFLAIPRGQLLSFIHLMAIGATTNALLAFVVHLSRRVSATSAVDDVVFWGVNIGLIGFVLALTLDIPAMIGLFVPIMGLALLVAIGAHLGPLGRAPAPEQEAIPTG